MTRPRDPTLVYQGKPCKNGHAGVRYRNGGACVDCIAANGKRYAREGRYRDAPAGAPRG